MRFVSLQSIHGPYNFLTVHLLEMVCFLLSYTVPTALYMGTCIAREKPDKAIGPCGGIRIAKVTIFTHSHSHLNIHLYIHPTPPIVPHHHFI